MIPPGHEKSNGPKSIGWSDNSCAPLELAHFLPDLEEIPMFKGLNLGFFSLWYPWLWVLTCTYKNIVSPELLFSNLLGSYDYRQLDYSTIDLVFLSWWWSLARLIRFSSLHSFRLIPHHPATSFIHAEPSLPHPVAPIDYLSLVTHPWIIRLRMNKNNNKVSEIK